jgi:hypothetical protein
MTNYDKWNFYLRDLRSPQSYIDICFYYLITSALQRRVWLDNDEYPLYPNLYVVLVGEPGIGKGLVLSKVNELLRHHKLIQRTKTPEDAIEGMMASNKAKKDNTEPLLFPVAPDSTTYEQLVRINALATRFVHTGLQHKFVKNKIYHHCSLSFVLPELSSLLHKQAQRIMNYLIVAYDCGDYEYDTKTQGKDVIKRTCLNFLAATQPNFMRSSFKDELIGEGFSSRTFFIFEAANRHNKFAIEKFTSEQDQAKMDILAHLKNLATLIGPVNYTPEAHEVFRHYYEEVLPKYKPNYDLKLQPYYARKIVHMQKLAMAVHFADSLEMTIQKESCIRALELCESWEKRMHHALQVQGNNPLSAPSAKALRAIQNAPNKKMTLLELWDALEADVNRQELIECLNFLIATKKIEIDPDGSYKIKGT